MCLKEQGGSLICNGTIHVIMMLTYFLNMFEEPPNVHIYYNGIPTFPIITFPPHMLHLFFTGHLLAADKRLAVWLHVPGVTYIYCVHSTLCAIMV